jgi:hypothetical protein
VAGDCPVALQVGVLSGKYSYCQGRLVMLGLASLPYYLEGPTIIWQQEEEALVKANKICNS